MAVFRIHNRWPLRNLLMGLAGLVILWWAAMGVTIANGYVLKGPHVLELMARALTGPQTLRVQQQVIIEDPDISDQAIELTETLSFIFPDRFRSDLRHEDTHRIHVVSQDQVLTVIDGKITANHENKFDRYKDLLLQRSRKMFSKTLFVHDVDVGITSLGRLDDHIVFVIGANYPDDSVSQLWVDKERFLPLRWLNILPGGDATDEVERLDFIYRNWQKLDGVWYPMQIETYHNQRRIRLVRTRVVDANTAIDGELFDISELTTRFQSVDQTEEGAPSDAEVEDVQRTIEDFKKKFEP